MIALRLVVWNYYDPFYISDEMFFLSIIGMIFIFCLVYLFSLLFQNKKVTQKEIIEKPIYYTLDILLQEKNIDFHKNNTIPINYRNEVENSIFIKVITIIMIIIIIMTPNIIK